MPIIRVDQISQYEGQEVTVQGWVYNRTDKGKLVFLLVRDGTGFVQCVAFKGDLDEAVFDQLVLYGKANAGENAAGNLEIGFKAGWGAFTIVRDAMDNLHAEVGFGMILYGMAAALAVSVFGSALPAWLTARIRPAEVMRND